MRAQVLVKHSRDAKEAFQLKNIDQPHPSKSEILVKVKYFGLNYADVMASKGLYNDAPDLPSVLGYEVVGEVVEKGDSKIDINIGDTVVGFCRFGGYAEYAIVNELAFVKVDPSLDLKQVLALTVQYATAYHAAIDKANILKGDTVLVHAAAGGVGTALIQLAKSRGCKVIGTVGSDEKKEYAKLQGADFVINYRKEDYLKVMKSKFGDKCIDAFFNPIGGKTFKKDFSMLRFNGTGVLFGVSTWSDKKGTIIDKLKLVWDFGFIHPLGLLMKSQTLAGVNMLRLGDDKPWRMQAIMNDILKEYDKGVFKPHIHAEFLAEDLPKAINLMSDRKTIGKVVVKW